MRREAVEEGKRWLEQSEEDLKWAKDLAQNLSLNFWKRSKDWQYWMDIIFQRDIQTACLIAFRQKFILKMPRRKL